MTCRRVFSIALGLAVALAPVAGASAAAIVLANQTENIVRFSIAPQQGKPQAYQIIAGDVLPIPVEGDVGIRFTSGAEPVYHVLGPNAVYYFFDRGQLELVGRAFGSGTPASDAPGASDEGEPADSQRRDAVGTIPVMVLVDDEEPAVRRLWEERLGTRLAEASAIFEHHCRLRFKVVATGTWESDDGVTDFELSMREFEKKVARPPGVRLVIGFTSQYQVPKGRTHLGGTRGPLHSHILIREWSQHISYTERLEVLVHELGHVFGAAHSADQNSVMRPVVGDRRSRARSFRIGFDPVNTLVLYTFGEQIRWRGAWSLDRFSPASRRLLSEIYTEMAKELPDDESAAKYLGLLDRAEQLGGGGRQQSLIIATRHVIHAVTEAARHNFARGQDPNVPPERSVRLEGDRLTDLYCRVAANVAKDLPKDLAGEAFLLGLAVAMDDSTELADHPPVGRLLRRFESPEARKQRLAVLGVPTMHGRRDLARHFVIASAIAALAGQFAAESAGLIKEQADLGRGSVFSFADLAADVAGATFAARVRTGQIPLEALAEHFTVSDFVPSPEGLPADLSSEAFAEKYGSLADPRFRGEQEKLRQRILALPGFSRKP